MRCRDENAPVELEVEVEEEVEEETEEAATISASRAPSSNPVGSARTSHRPPAPTSSGLPCISPTFAAAPINDANSFNSNVLNIIKLSESERNG